MGNRSARPLGHQVGKLTIPVGTSAADAAPIDGGIYGTRPGLCALDDGTMCRLVSCLPGPSREDGLIATMTANDKLIEAMRRTGPMLPASLREEFMGLLSPVNLTVTAGVLAVWAGSHAFGAGEVIDVILVVAGGVFLGLSVFSVVKDLVLFVEIGARAKTGAELDAAARHLARFVSVVGVATFVAILMKVGGKAVPRRISGLVDQEGAPAAVVEGATAEGPWWEATDFGPDYPGTSVPQWFKLKVGRSEFTIKGNATRHMQEFALRRGTTSGRAGQVEYPISALAGALEQVEKSGDLGPLLRGQIKRLGTEASPYQKGGWEFSIENVNGRLEVLHAVPKVR